MCRGGEGRNDSRSDPKVLNDMMGLIYHFVTKQKNSEDLSIFDRFLMIYQTVFIYQFTTGPEIPWRRFIFKYSVIKELFVGIPAVF